MFLGVNVENLVEALNISWKSLVALFLAMFLLYISIVLLSKIKEKNKQ